MEQQTKKKVIVIIGPTAVGKTALSIRLAQDYGGEIINGDSMQVYRELNIGTAKITAQEMESIPHHLLDVLDAKESFSASEFRDQAASLIEEIHARGKLPIIVGGTGLYIEGLLRGMSFGGETSPDTSVRKKWEQLALERGNAFVWKLLQEQDPEAAALIHENNSRRVIRALEVIDATGKKFSSQEDRQSAAYVYDGCLIGLTTKREVLYDRIEERVDKMIQLGLIEEARKLYDRKLPSAAQSLKGIGYKEWFPFFDGKISYEEAVDLLKKNSRRYAKRQLTWFRNRMENVHWFDLVLKHTYQDVQRTVDQFIEIFPEESRD